MTIEVVQKDKVWWLVINGVEIAFSKLQCDALLIAKNLEATKKEAVAWRVKDYADGWILYHDERMARHQAEETGALIQPLVPK